MKYLKKLSFIFIFIFIILGITKVEAKEKVKVYIFEAGGCPYCEAEIEYLEKLDSYGEKFEIVRKELYVDHIDWEQGRDYELGKNVAEAFQQAGFDDASYMGTPFVVISDIYATSAYSESLESVIDEAYVKGDKDVVSCIERGRSNCLKGVKNNTTTDDQIENNNPVSNEDINDFTTSRNSNESNNSSNTLIIVLLAVFLIISVILNVVLLVLYATKKKY